MPQFVHKIKAVQFTGGQACADQLAEWAWQSGATVVYDSANDRAVILLVMSYSLLNVGDWFVERGPSDYIAMSNDAFQGAYHQLPEETEEADVEQPQDAETEETA